MWLTVLPDECFVKLVPCENSDACQRRFSLPSMKEHLHLHIDCEEGCARVPFPLMSTVGLSRLLDMLDQDDPGWYTQMLPVLLQATEAQYLLKELTLLEETIFQNPDLTKIVHRFGYVSER
jgi:hypothetical protein